jgi:hypothetical protein
MRSCSALEDLHDWHGGHSIFKCKIFQEEVNASSAWINKVYKWINMEFHMDKFGVWNRNIYGAHIVLSRAVR